jgi:hypothetical protein
VTARNVISASMYLPVVHVGREIGSTPLNSSVVSDNVRRNAQPSELLLHPLEAIVDCATKRNQRIWQQDKRDLNTTNEKWDVGSCQVLVCAECWPEYTHGLEL